MVAVWKLNGVEHGLIASLTDIGTTTAWSSVTSTTVPAPGAVSLTDGLANSNAIVSQSTTSAANLCRVYSAPGDGGLHDWYLPALWELNICCSAAYIVNNILSPANGFQYAVYWSSSEKNSNTSWAQNFFNGAQDLYYKSSTQRIRAVRKF